MPSPAGKPKKRLRLPVGILTSYGPDAETITKIIVSVYPDTARPATARKKWFGPALDSDAQADGEIRQWLRSQRVRTLVVRPGPSHCPHEEGVDFPRGGDCPHCPYWKGKQGSGAAGEDWAKVDLRDLRVVDVKEPGARWSLRG